MIWILLKFQTALKIWILNIGKMKKISKIKKICFLLFKISLKIYHIFIQKKWLLLGNLPVTMLEIVITYNFKSVLGSIKKNGPNLRINRSNFPQLKKSHWNSTAHKIVKVVKLVLMKFWLVNNVNKVSC